MGADDDIIARLVKKTLFVGVFAYIIGNWNNLARIVFEQLCSASASRGSGTGFSVTDLIRGRAARRRPASTPAARCSIPFPT